MCVFRFFRSFKLGLIIFMSIDEWFSCALTTLLKQFQSYQVDVKVIIKDVHIASRFAIKNQEKMECTVNWGIRGSEPLVSLREFQTSLMFEYCRRVLV